MAAKNEVNEAIEAMTALGYSPAEAVKAVRQITITDGMDAGEILKLALKNRYEIKLFFYDCCS